MPLIKINEVNETSEYINSDHIVSIRFARPGTSLIRLINDCIEVSDATVHYLASMLDAVDFGFATGQPVNLSLQSRLAIHLRNQSTPQTFYDLQQNFTDNEDALHAALNELLANNVIASTLSLESHTPLYFHASQMTAEASMLDAVDFGFATGQPDPDPSEW